MRFILILLWTTALLGEVTVDLREPLLKDGKISTTQGGVIQADKLRIQAQNISYIKNAEMHQVEASTFVMVDFGDYVFIGDRLSYDFLTGTGTIDNGITRDLPWYFGGETIELCANGSYVIHNAFITTSEMATPDWQIKAERVVIKKNHSLDISGVKLKLLDVPLFWIPTLKLNFSSLTEAPLRFYGRWGGKQGVRVGAKYSLFDFNRFKAYLRMDWRFKRGPGGGIETYYSSEDRKHSLETINYYAHDNSLEDLDEKIRYRFQGIYKNSLNDDKISVYASWDKLSDKDMPTDYNDEGLELGTAEKTELLMRRQDAWWITNFSSRLRVNQFQTVKQELPSLLLSQKPYAIDKLGVLVENQIETSYLDFKYSNDLRNVSDYNSPRLLHEVRLLRPFHQGNVTLTPIVGANTALYGNSPARNSKFLLLGYAALKGNTSLYQTFGNFKHVVNPYFEWEYLSMPTVNPDSHYIFDIQDGLWQLNSVKVGARQSLLMKNQCGAIKRLVDVDFYTYQFINSAPIPKLFANINWRTHSNVKHSIYSAWDFNVNQIDHINFRNDWTVSNDCAVSFEWRHRSRYSWRKAVSNNFVLDSFRSTHSLLNSSVSDRRDTMLCHLFWRIHPLFAIEFESRHGWYRTTEPSYTEFEIDFLAKLRSHWNVKVSYVHTEADDRVAIYFSLDFKQPKDSSCLILPIEF